jgi:hypothetical protein
MVQCFVQIIEHEVVLIVTPINHFDDFLFIFDVGKVKR